MRGCDWKGLREESISILTCDELEVGGGGDEDVVRHGGVVAKPLQQRVTRVPANTKRNRTSPGTEVNPSAFSGSRCLVEGNWHTSRLSSTMGPHSPEGVGLMVGHEVRDGLVALDMCRPSTRVPSPCNHVQTGRMQGGRYVSSEGALRTHSA